MRPTPTLMRILPCLLVTLTLAACEQDSDATAEEPSAAVDETVDKAENADSPEQEGEPVAKPGPTPPPPERTPEPLVEALDAPDDAVTSSGRLDKLMERGLAEHMPEIGILYGAAGVEQPGVRIAVAADGRGRWARGKNPYYGELEHSGDFELSEEEAAEIAGIIREAWTSKVDYPPSSVKQTRVLVLRDGKHARLFEHSGLPSSLARIEEILRGHLPAENQK